MLKNLRGVFVADMASLSICFAQKCHTLAYIGLREYVTCGLERKNCRQFNHVPEHTKVIVYADGRSTRRVRDNLISSVYLRDRSAFDGKDLEICIKQRFQSENRSE